MKKRRFHLPLSIVVLNLFLAILPIVSGIVIYNRILAVVSEDLAESNLRVLKQGIKNIEEKYTSMGELFFPLIDNFSIIRCKNLKEPYSGGNVIRLLDVLKDFSLIQSSRVEDYILDSFLYFCTNDIVITPQTVYRSEIFFKDQLQFTKSDQETWFMDIREQSYNFKIIPQQNIIYNGKDYHINILIHSLYSGTGGTEVYYISLLNEKFFLDQLDGLDYSHEGHLSVLQDGNMLYQYGQEQEPLEIIDLEKILQFEGKEGYELQKEDRPERLISYVYSPLRRITFILEQNSLTQISRVLRDMSQIVIYGGIFYVFLASLLSFFLTKRSRITLYSSHIIARDSIMNALYHGDIIDESELEKAWKRLNLDNTGKYWGISLLAVNPFSSQLINELLTGDQLDINHLESTLNDIMPSFFSLHYPESNRLLLIHSFTESNKESSINLWRKEINNFIDFFKKRSDYNLYIGMGTLQKSKIQLFDSFAQARQALNTQIRSREPGIGEFDANEMQGGLELPKNIFTTLEAYIFQEDLQGIETVFRNLEKILFDPSLSFVLKQYLITTIYGQVMDMSERIGKTRLLNWSPDFFGRINTNEGIKKIFFQLQEKTHFISAQKSTSKRSHNSKLLDEILNEIQNNMSNSNVNAAMIAEKCGITETYLYQFFKEQTGQTFAVYVEKRRIEKARDLLLNSQFSIGEIALMTGYSSSNTFGRAFKRNMGLSAGKYRENRGETDTIAENALL